MLVKLYQCGNEISSYTEYPLGLGYLKTNCHADVEIVNEKSELRDCDLIGLSTNAWGVKEAVEIVQASQIPIVVGGQGTLWNKLEDYPFRHIVKGEGEQALDYIIKGSNKKILRFENIKDIDFIKFPDRGKCTSTQMPIITSRGCPHNCAFCSSQSFWGKPRFHSALYFINEVEYLLKTYPQIKILRIEDDLFIANKKRFNEIYELWMKKELNKRLSIRSFIRANIFDLDTAEKMKAMGFFIVRFGAESGSDRILKVLEKNITVEQNQKCIDIARSIDLTVSASFMYNTPTETEAEKQMTLDFIKRNKLLVEGWYKFKKFPGTKFYEGEDLMEEDMRVRKIIKPKVPNKGLWSGERVVRESLFDFESCQLARYATALDYISKEDTVLDLGCGCGYGSHILSHKAKTVTGVDNSEQTIVYANKHHKRPNIKFVYGQALGVAGKYDVVVVFESIEHIEDTDKIFKKIGSLVKKKLIITMPHITCPMRSRFHYRHFSRTEIEKYLKMVGLIIVYYNRIRFRNGDAIFCVAEGPVGPRSK